MKRRFQDLSAELDPAGATFDELASAAARRAVEPRDLLAWWQALSADGVLARAEDPRGPARFRVARDRA
ncbi:MAG: hypothetical protein ACJ762_16865 [Solirubrobacteraceae bacterium]